MKHNVQDNKNILSRILEFFPNECAQFIFEIRVSWNALSPKTQPASQDSFSESQYGEEAKNHKRNLHLGEKTFEHQNRRFATRHPLP